MAKTVEKTEILAWVGEDEHGSGEVGIKIGLVPAGAIPLAAVAEHRDKLERLGPAMQQQADAFGKTIRLVRFTFEEVLVELEPQGKP